MWESYNTVKEEFLIKMEVYSIGNTMTYSQ